MHISKKVMISVFAVEIIMMLALAYFVVDVFASDQRCTIKVGNKTIASVKDTDEAKKAIAIAKEKYVDPEATNVQVDIEPVVRYETKFYGKKGKKPKLETSVEAGNTICNSTDIEVKQTVKKRKTVEYKTVVKKTDKLPKGKKKVDQNGKEGATDITTVSMSINGEVMDTNVVEEVVEKPVEKIVLQGTKEDKDDDDGLDEVIDDVDDGSEEDDGKTYGKKDGNEVAKYALQFVGNPYVWGGESLTKGADCSGFVLAVYKHFGVSLPHDAGLQRDYGKGVKLKDAKPGDLICFYGHIGIYIGNGKLVHAMDESHGIVVSKLGYNGKKILTVRRMFD